MSSTVDILRRRRRNRDRQAKGPLPAGRRGVLIIAAVLSITVGVLGVAISLAYSSLTADLPSLQTIPDLLDENNGLFAEPTVIYDRTGTVPLATLGARAPAGTYLPIRSELGQQLSPELVEALLAAVDPDFRDHPGFHTDDLFSTEPDTIAWQLAADLVFWDEAPGLRRTLREKLYAAQLVETYGRDRVLEWFLNSAHFGRLAFGAEAAARLYFGKSASALDLPEAAVLAAAAQAPHLNPFDTPEVARARRDAVLAAMVEQGDITMDAFESAAAAPLGVRDRTESLPDSNAAFLAGVQLELEDWIPIEVLARGGLVVITTLDATTQAELNCTLAAQLARVSGEAAVLPDDCAAARLLPSYSGSAVLGPGLAAEGTVIDPLSGQVLALARQEAAGGSGPAVSLHAPGSLLTPYVYLTAFTRGLGPASLVWDIPAYWNRPGDSPNPDGAFHGPLRVRNALAGDALVPALQLLAQFGPANVWGTAALSGLTSLSGQSGPLLLEGGALSVLEVVHGYSAFSTQGVLIGYPDEESLRDPRPLRTTTLLRVEDIGGRVWLDPGPPQARPVMSAPLAYAITNMLSDETARWPALGHPNALEVGRPAGVKMGFTQDGRNAWTVGFTPQVSVGIWIGFDAASGSEDTVDPAAAAGAWHAVIKQVTADLPPLGWSPPQGISEVDVCDPSGLLPTPECPVVVREIFLPGNEPVQADTLYRKFEINRETGLLATIFTPPNLIEEIVFLVPPPEALSWAEQAGLDVPPENYDLVSQPPAPSEHAFIAAPQMFAYLSGEVVISGAAGGPGFQSYSLQVGQGLNPQQWLELTVSEAPVEQAGDLAHWDTSGLSGLYAIRLLVLREDNLVETHIIQVTVDNTPPELAVSYPADGQVFAYPEDSSVTVQLTAADDLALARIEIYLDRRLVHTLTRPPYAFALDLTPGEHSLRIVAVDGAGNETEVTRSLDVQR